MTTAGQWPERFLSREMQFCAICHAAGRGWVRVANVADMMELRKGRPLVAALRAFKARRRRAVLRHLAMEHNM